MQPEESNIQSEEQIKESELELVKAQADELRC